ncbi:SPOC domain-containing protein [Cephalotus follicularis]|uniref:SPOC domain-containing protein n=1 Tax=Cephalotus follicularis TaxID=3775 RepID=A0A1Q3D798_CEPFO|nr:SPOC domain-containing protein [Cephalotus follicularis]
MVKSGHNDKLLQTKVESGLSSKLGDDEDDDDDCGTFQQIPKEKISSISLTKSCDHQNQRVCHRKTTATTTTSVAERLWDGILQLNSSITVSAVAFFKSGEKMPDVKWSEFVEVKGKVKLDAFEKYIQDLPRSRNRGLMVISLRWKEGSSESGLAGMKKVANGYKQGERIGFAQLAPGVDLYICPRSNTIITILARHGFFKGMVAIEDNQDSLIGCVVWRRIRAFSDFVAKKSGKNYSLTEQSLDSTFHSSDENFVDKNLACKKPVQESIPVALAKNCTTLEIAGSNQIEIMNSESSEVQLELQYCSTGANLLQKPSILSSTSVSAGSKTSPLATLVCSMGQSPEAPLTHNLRTEKTELGLGVQIPAFSHALMKGHVSTPDDDDDDLPEFDFGCRSRTLRYKSSDAVIFDKKLPTEGYKNVDVPFRSEIPTVQSIPAFTKRRMEKFNLPGISVDAIAKLPPLKKVSMRDFVPALPILEEHTVPSRAIKMPTTATADQPPNNLFNDDDDDMPEWRPPHIGLHKQSVPQSPSRTSISIPSKTRSSTLESSYYGHPSPLLPSLPADNPSFSTQAFPCVNRFPSNFLINPAQPRPLNEFIQRAPTSLMGFNTNPVLRLPPNPFEVKFPIHPTGWRPL